MVQRFSRFPFRGMNPTNGTVPQIAAWKPWPILGYVIQAVVDEKKFYAFDSNPRYSAATLLEHRDVKIILDTRYFYHDSHGISA